MEIVGEEGGGETRAELKIFYLANKQAERKQTFTPRYPGERGRGRKKNEE